MINGSDDLGMASWGNWAETPLDEVRIRDGDFWILSMIICLGSITNEGRRGTRRSSRIRATSISSSDVEYSMFTNGK